jgi:hypothetical protein
MQGHVLAGLNMSRSHVSRGDTWAAGLTAMGGGSGKEMLTKYICGYWRPVEWQSCDTTTAAMPALVNTRPLAGDSAAP